MRSTSYIPNFAIANVSSALYIVRSCYQNAPSSKALSPLGSRERFLALRCQAVLYSITSFKFSIRIFPSFSPFSSVSSLATLKKKTRPHCSIHSSKFSLPSEEKWLRSIPVLKCQDSICLATARCARGTGILRCSPTADFSLLWKAASHCNIP